MSPANQKLLLLSRQRLLDRERGNGRRPAGANKRTRGQPAREGGLISALRVQLQTLRGTDPGITLLTEVEYISLILPAALLPRQCSADDRSTQCWVSRPKAEGSDVLSKAFTDQRPLTVWLNSELLKGLLLDYSSAIANFDITTILVRAALSATTLFHRPFPEGSMKWNVEIVGYFSMHGSGRRAVSGRRPGIGAPKLPEEPSSPNPMLSI
jgi:hypothetical protein